MDRFIFKLETALAGAKSRLFHDRQVIIISNNRIKRFNFSARVQSAFVVIILSALCFAAFSAGKFSAPLVPVTKEDADRVRSIERSLTRLEQHVMNIRRFDKFSAIRIPDAMKPQISYLEPGEGFASLETRRDNLALKVYGEAAAKIAVMEQIFQVAGLDYTAISGKPKAGAEGGPFVPANLENDEEKISFARWLDKSGEFRSSLDYLSGMQGTIYYLPFALPIKDSSLSSGFGYRIDPFNRIPAKHSGVDLKAEENSPVYSTAPGIVTYSGRKGAYGNMVEIDHGYGVRTRYAHLSRIFASEGARVMRGQVIGTQGSTGRSTGDHLHYEVRYNDKPMDPYKFIVAGLYVYYPQAPK